MLACLRIRRTTACGVIGAQFCNELDIEIMAPYRPSAEERAQPRLYAENVRAAMGAALGAPLSSHGIVQQQALKRAGVHVDWSGRCGPGERPAQMGLTLDLILVATHRRCWSVSRRRRRFALQPRCGRTDWGPGGVQAHHPVRVCRETSQGRFVKGRALGRVSRSVSKLDLLLQLLDGASIASCDVSVCQACTLAG